MSTMKASDITDEQIYEAIRARRTVNYYGDWTGVCWTNIANEVFPHFPRKIVHAKIRQMIAKKRLDGCPCGCRGDLSIQGGFDCGQ